MINDSFEIFKARLSKQGKFCRDISSHVREVGMLDEDKVLDVLNSTSHLIREGISKEIPIFPMIGNHDYFPKSQLPASDGLYKKIANIFCPIFNLDGDGGGCNKFMEGNKPYV